MQHLVLLPGLNNTAKVWDGVVAVLQERACCHALDNPALESVDAIAAKLLDESPARFRLCGFSFGGYVALAMLERAPERIAGLALMCTAAAADSPQQAAQREKSLQTALAGGYEQLIAAQAAHAFHPESLGDTGLMARRASMVSEYGAQAFAAHQRAALARPDRSALLARYAGPLAFIAASHDKVFPPEGMQRAAQAIPGARFERIEGAGHLAPMEKAGETARALRAWLEMRTA